jgi:DNA-binding NtrC family response regulator
MACNKKMKIAVIEDTKALHDIYEDMFFMHTVEFFNTVDDFILKAEVYPVVIIDHRVDNKSWEDVFKVIDESTFLIVTSTFAKDFYKKEFPDTLYKSIEKVNDHKNAVHYHKDERNRFLDYISRAVELEALRANCRA